MTRPCREPHYASMQKRIYIFACLALAAAGCVSTITPNVPAARQASWDGNAQNSGFMGFDASGNGILTPHARDRYNALVDAFGSRMQPAVRRDEGIVATSTNTFLIDAQHLEYFATWQRWLREGVK